MKPRRSIPQSLPGAGPEPLRHKDNYKVTANAFKQWLERRKKAGTLTTELPSR